MPPEIPKKFEQGPHKSKLLPEEIRRQLPPLYSGEKQGENARAIVKFFTPDSNWTWYASEGSPVDKDGLYDTNKTKVSYLFFGLVSGFEVELGYFSLAELEQSRGPMGLPIERDLHFQPKSLRELRAMHEHNQPR